jgi:hypothetical protein
MIRIYLNSVADSNTPINAPSLWLDVTNSCEGIEDLELTYSRKDSVVQRAISNSLTFYGSAYDLIYDRMVTNQANHIWVKIEIDGFGYTFPYCQILWKAIEWCTDRCELNVNLTTWNADLDAYRSLKNTLIWDDAFLNSLTYNNPFTGQVEQAHPLLRVAQSDPLLALDDDWKYGILGIYIRHYYYNLCDKVGLLPSSSIFDYTGLNAWTGDDYDDHNYYDDYGTGQDNNREGRNPYHHSAVFLNLNGEAAGNKSQQETQKNAFKVNQSTRPTPKAINNALNYNGIQFLDNFGQVFNARYRVKNGLLEFERKDYFYLTTNEWSNLSHEDLCLKIKIQDNWSYLRLEYQQESTMWNNAFMEFSSFISPTSLVTEFPPFPEYAEKYYNEIVEWNSPVSTRQEGELSRILPFAMLRTANNGIRRDNTTTKRSYDIKSWEISEPIIMATKETSAMNSRLPYESSEQIDSNGAYRRFFNRPFYTKKISETTLYSGVDFTINWKGTLYDNFHFIDDPRRRPNERGYEPKEPYKTFEFTMTTDFDCQMLNTFDIDNYITTKVGQASMEEVVFKFKNLEVEIKGFV